MKNISRLGISVLCAILFLQTCVFVCAEETSYAEYKSRYKAADTKEAIHLRGADGTGSEGANIEKPAGFEGQSDVLVWKGEAGTVTWTFLAPAEGLYQLEMLYYALPGKKSNIELALAVNGETPFRGAEKFTFFRLWKDDWEENIPFETDSSGNELSPQQIEIPDWQSAFFRDQEGFDSDPLLFRFKEGENTISLTCLRGELVIAGLTLSPPEMPLPYVKPDSKDINNTPMGYLDKIQAERAVRKSDSSLRADFDRSDPLTEPFSPTKTLQNIIGGNRWSAPGQWIEWSFTVPVSGYYRLCLRYRQNAVRGFFTSRRISIDGKVPFRELDAVHFPYSKDWSTDFLGGEEPYLFYFEQDTVHTIRMEVTVGEMGDSLLHLQDCQRELSSLYRKIIMITGKNPDPNRDYDLDKEIPGLLDTMLTLSEQLKAEAKSIESAAGFSGSEAATLYRMSEQLEGLVEDPYTIPRRLSAFGDTISSLAAWVMEVRRQPLELDYIAVMAPDATRPKARAGFFQKLWSGTQSFVYSFFADYNTIRPESSEDDGIEVWIGAGNEQLTVLNRLIQSGFTAKTKIPATLKLVDAGMLVQSVMAGIQPDAAVNVSRTDPVNLAMRGALEPLDKYSGFEAVTERFMPAAMEPYKFYGNHYALPDSQTFNMMFYRTDIFEELGLKPPETWEDLYAAAAIIQRKNMDIGIPAGAFNMLLLQQGGSFYNKDKTATALNTEIAGQSFVQWVEFYTKYGYPLFKDDYTRFRMGEMPLTIMPYPFYCQLMVAAPEIRGLWAMCPIPGTRQEDGSINRADSATGTACVLLSKSNQKQKAWQFMDWWTSPEVQTNYSLELEAVMGTAARYSTAATEAFAALPWTALELETLKTQWSSVTELPELPGGYYVTRNIDNAFRASVYRGENPLESLRYWTRETDKEIGRKLREYNLGVQP